MSIPLTIQGVTYNYPTEGDLGWGQQATAWAAAVTNSLGPGSNATFLTVHVTGASALDGAVTMGSTLSVTGLTTMLGGAAITGAVTMSSTLNVTGLATVGSVSVAGAATFATSPTMPTPAYGDSTTNGATTAFVQTAVKGPAFSAYQSVAQVVTTSTWTKLNLQSELFDTANCFDTTTYRFTPNVAGYYQISAAAATTTAVTTRGIQIYKTGIPVKYLAVAPSTSMADAVGGSCLIPMNGTTDYLEVWVYLVGVTPALQPLALTTYFEGFLARAL